jgi:hypothetical protein
VTENALRATRDKILHRNNAQEILQALATLEERRAEFTTRWLWELIQNARDFPDPSRPMTIRISVSDEQITFAHNGRDFTRDEILSLIYHGSTKQSNPEQLGKFGTGFLSTHLLSRQVTVRGTLRDDEHGRRAFEFELDRSGDDADAVGDAMQRSFEALEDSLDQSDLELADWTEFVYAADGTLDTEELETDFPFDALPYILVFDAKVGKIEIELPERSAAYARIEDEETGTDLRLAVIEGVGSVSRFSTHEENGIHAAVPVEERADSSYAIAAPGDVPRFFKFLPLVNSSTIGLPAVFHSRSFSTTENRDGLQFGTSGLQSDFNKRLLAKASQCFLNLAQKCAEAEFEELHRLLDLRAVSDSPAWLEDRPRYAEWQRTMIRGLSAIPLVELKSGEKAAAAVADFPVGDEAMEWDDVYNAGCDLAPERAVAGSIAEACSDTALGWTELLEDDDDLIEACVLTPSRVIERVKDAENLEELGAQLGLEAEQTVEWLNEFIAAVDEGHRRISLDGLIPDQTPEGAFRSNAELGHDSGIDEALKDVLEAVGEPIRQRLVHGGVKGTEVMIRLVHQSEPLIAQAKDLLKKLAPAPPQLEKYRAACLTMFQWLAAGERWQHLGDAIPVYTLDGDGAERLSKTSASTAALLVPRGLWPEKARAYWNAFPNGSVLVDDYAPLLDSDEWDEVAANGVVIGALLSIEDEELTDLEKYTPDLELEGDGHGAAATIAVTKLALVGTETFYNAVRGSRERAARFLQFILDYVVEADDSWKRIEDVECECSEHHEIIPSEWLAWIRDREWVPGRRGAHERLTNSSLSQLTRDDARLADMVIREEHTEFLNLTGINVLEQALLAADQSQRSELRRQLALLARLAAQHPDTVTQLIQNIEARQEANKRWRENQKLGKIVEDLIGARLKSRLSLLRIRVRPQFRGYDLGAYVDDASYADVGWIDVQQGETLIAKIEIKSTRGDAVSMSNVQGAEASNDLTRYWLCVVPLDPGEDIDELTAERVEDMARFVSGIGERLAPAQQGIQGAVESADESGFDLEHIDDIRYGIRSEIWESEAVSLTDFVDWLGKRLIAVRR